MPSGAAAIAKSMTTMPSRDLNADVSPLAESRTARIRQLRSVDLAIDGLRVDHDRVMREIKSVCNG